MHRSPRPSNVEIRADDHGLTGHAGLLLTGELATHTDLVARLDRAIDGVRPFNAVVGAVTAASCWSRWPR